MKPVSPVIKGFEQHEIILAKDQPQYIPLPTLVVEGDEKRMISRWEFSDLEREQIAKGASLLLEQLTFGSLYHPIALSIMDKPKVQITDESCLCNGVGCNHCAPQGVY